MKSRIRAELIINYIKDNNMSKTKFAKMCNISYSTLNKILENKFNFYVKSLFRVAKILHKNVFELFEDSKCTIKKFHDNSWNFL